MPWAWSPGLFAWGIITSPHLTVSLWCYWALSEQHLRVLSINAWHLFIYFTNYTSDKGLISRLNKELEKPSTDTQCKSKVAIAINISQKIFEWRTALWGKVNQNHDESAFYLSKKLLSKMTNNGKGLVVVLVFLCVGLKTNLVNKQLWKDKWKYVSLHLKKDLAICEVLYPGMTISLPCDKKWCSTVEGVD